MPEPTDVTDPAARVRRLATDDEAKALASTLRMRILRSCLGDPRTNKEIAEILDRDPASTLHHVRRLVDTGFLVAQPVRRGTRGSREIPYLATGKSWTLSTPHAGAQMLETFVEEVSLVSAEKVDITRIGLRLTAADREDFAQRMHELLEEFFARSKATTTGDRQAWSVFVAVHPDPNRP